MIVIKANNVNDAWPQALDIMDRRGVKRPSRAGPVIVVPEPVSTVYSSPTKRVLMDPVRDANPFFHLAESLWMLAGRDDATWLDQFVSDFSARFAEADGRQHGAYGMRWRNWFAYPDIPLAGMDQLSTVIKLLKKDPYDRQCVIQMWDATADLGVPGLKDRPCNTQIYLRCDRTKRWDAEDPADPPRDLVGHIDPETGHIHVLDMTVTCRSNDIVWGCYGANAVHFAFLQEYLAARIGVSVGNYTQVSNNWHMYEATRDKASLASAEESMWKRVYPGVRRLVDDPGTFDAELDRFLAGSIDSGANNGFLLRTALPMFNAYFAHKNRDADLALSLARGVEAPDWRAAAVAWLGRRGRK